MRHAKSRSSTLCVARRVLEFQSLCGLYLHQGDAGCAWRGGQEGQEGRDR
jgi:hypothetical protein